MGIKNQKEPKKTWTIKKLRVLLLSKLKTVIQNGTGCGEAVANFTEILYTLSSTIRGSA